MSSETPIYAVPSRRRRRIPPLSKGVYVLPNLFTTGGLFAGFYSIILTLQKQYEMAAFMILLATLCDVLDGRIARLTRSTSSFGIQYDSLSDLVAFGVAPGILIYQWALQPWGRAGWLAATLYVTCGALRLARFNVQIASVEKRHFVGLPIPAAADLVAATVLAYYWFGREGLPSKHVLMPIVIFTVAGLMVSEIRYYSFKEIRFHHRHPFWVLLALIGLIAVAVLAPVPTLFVTIVAYACSGPIALGYRLARGRRGESPEAREQVPGRPVVLDKAAPRR